MKKKKSRLTSLILALAVLVLALAVFLIVQKRATAYNDAQSAASEKDTLFDVSVDQIEKVSYTSSGSEELSFTRNTESTEEISGDVASDSSSAASETTVWTCDQHPDAVLDSTKVGALASSLTGVSITQEMDGVTDLGQYGLDKPAVTGSFTTRDGKTTAFAIGSTNSAASVVYVYLNDDKATVYAVSTGLTSYMNQTIDKYLPDSSAAASAES